MGRHSDYAYPVQPIPYPQLLGLPVQSAPLHTTPDPTNSRSPDDANVRNKMIYASSKDALRARLDGIATELQATDFSEITQETRESPD